MIGMLRPVEMGTYDVIIGMDWLTKYQAVIDCAKKIVRIPFGSEILIFHGDGNKSKKSTANVPIVKNSPKYSRQGLAMPSTYQNKWKVHIDLVPGAIAPEAQAPYRFGPSSEMKELAINYRLFPTKAL
ncbi:putative reverse transcriptase domain-containing protein [Tanacetum coccineum]